MSRPQECYQPAVTAVNGPSGGSTRPSKVFPQHTTEAQPTRMPVAGCYGGESAFRRVGSPIPVVAPAGDGPVGAQPTRMLAAGCYGGELAFRRVCQPILVVAPAGDGPIGVQPTRVEVAGCYGGELALGWVCLPVVVAAASASHRLPPRAGRGRGTGRPGSRPRQPLRLAGHVRGGAASPQPMGRLLGASRRRGRRRLGDHRQSIRRRSGGPAHGVPPQPPAAGSTHPTPSPTSGGHRRKWTKHNDFVGRLLL